MKASVGGKGLTKESARSRLDKLQVGIGILLLLSATTGSYLLLTDGSLWNLALSHAVGLVVIVLVDLSVGMLSLFSLRRAYVASLAAAVLAIVLQLGDILTAPQYNMAIGYFASYLFGLWAFDLLLASQFVVVALGLIGRQQAIFLSRMKSKHGKELDYSRRGFMKSLGVFGGLVGVAALLSSIKLPIPTSQAQTTTTASGAPAGAIANKNALKTGSPVYFEYPSGYPNMLLLLADGTLSAVSLLCTHVCCECKYVPSAKEIACPCHGSIFDPSGRVVQGPAAVDLPKITLRTDSNGYIFPTGVSSPGPCQV